MSINGKELIAKINSIIDYANYGMDEKHYLMFECPHESPNYEDADRDSYNEAIQGTDEAERWIKASPALVKELFHTLKALVDDMAGTDDECDPVTDQVYASKKAAAELIARIKDNPLFLEPQEAPVDEDDDLPVSFCPKCDTETPTSEGFCTQCEGYK